VDVPGAAVGQKYKFIVGDRWRIDPRARQGAGCQRHRAAAHAGVRGGLVLGIQPFPV